MPPAIHRGPWHCAKCLAHFKQRGLRDVTLDSGLMAHLAGVELHDGDEFARCALAARFMQLDDAGRLLTKGKEDTWVEVPPIADRLEIAHSAQATCGFADGRCLLELLRSHFFW